jgi:hypothetical protein
MKIRPVGAKLFHADRWTDRHDELFFRNYAKAPKIDVQYFESYFLLMAR